MFDGCSRAARALGDHALRLNRRRLILRAPLVTAGLLLFSGRQEEAASGEQLNLILVKRRGRIAGF